MTKCGIIEHILNWVKFKTQAQLNKKGGTKTSKLKGIPKLDDANDAGTKNSERLVINAVILYDCNLMLGRILVGNTFV